jgi:hypothetical protein
MSAGQPMKYQTLELLQEAIDNYFEVDAFMPTKEGDKEYLPTMAGLALSLDVDRKTIVNYGRNQEYFHAIKKARAKIECFVETRLYGNNVTGCIFNLKNNFDWKDKQEIETKDTTNEVSDEDLNAKILELMEKLK